MAQVPMNDRQLQFRQLYKFAI